MTKAIELNVGTEEARKTLIEIMGETEKIRQEYFVALNDFDSPLKPIEDKYDVQLHRLSSIAKEDISLAREMGRLDVLGSMQSVMTDYFEKRATQEAVKQLEDKLPAIMSLGQNALLDFFMASDASVNSPFAFHCPMFISRRAQVALKTDMGFPAAVAENVGNINIIYLFDNKKKLFIPGANASCIRSFLSESVKYNYQGIFMLSSLMEKINWIHYAPLIKTIPEMFLEDPNNIKDNKIDGGIYKIDAKTTVVDNPPQIPNVTQINPAKLSIFQQFITPEKVDEFVKGYINGRHSDGRDGYARSSEKLACLLNFYDRNSLEFKLDGFTITFKKDEEKINQV